MCPHLHIAVCSCRCVHTCACPYLCVSMCPCLCVSLLLLCRQCPASTVQILGAEKALFRALKSKGNTPKYGLIFHSSFIGRAGTKNKGRVSRYGRGAVVVAGVPPGEGCVVVVTLVSRCCGVVVFDGEGFIGGGNVVRVLPATPCSSPCGPARCVGRVLWQVPGEQVLHRRPCGRVLRGRHQQVRRGAAGSGNAPLTQRASHAAFGRACLGCALGVLGAVVVVVAR